MDSSLRSHKNRYEEVALCLLVTKRLTLGKTLIAVTLPPVTLPSDRGCSRDAGRGLSQWSSKLIGTQRQHSRTWEWKGFRNDLVWVNPNGDIVEQCSCELQPLCAGHKWKNCYLHPLGVDRDGDPYPPAAYVIAKLGAVEAKEPPEWLRQG